MINYNFDSKEEEYFYFWIEELYTNGYISKVYPERETFLLFDKVELPWVTQLKTKVKQNSFTLIGKKSYTPDFCFEFTNKAENVFVFNSTLAVDKRKAFIDVNKSKKIYVDVKGEFGGNLSSAITFPDRQSIMWHVHETYVHKIVPFVKKKKNCLFCDTFTPKKVSDIEIYTTTRKGKWKAGGSKIKYKQRSLKEYING